jgi:hypothetical protein
MSALVPQFCAIAESTSATGHSQWDIPTQPAPSVPTPTATGHDFDDVESFDSGYAETLDEEPLFDLEPVLQIESAAEELDTEGKDPSLDSLNTRKPCTEQTPKIFIARTISQDLTGSEASHRKDLLCALQGRPRVLKIASAPSVGLKLSTKRLFAEETGSGNGSLKLSKKLFAEASGKPFGKRRKI